MGVDCYCFNRRKWVLLPWTDPNPNSWGHSWQKKKKREKKLVVLAVIHASPLLLVPGWVIILSHNDLLRAADDSKKQKCNIKIKQKDYMTWLLSCNSDKSHYWKWQEHTRFSCNTINKITNLLMKYWKIYSKSKWKEKTGSFPQVSVRCGASGPESDLWSRMTGEIATSSCANWDQIRTSSSFTFQGGTGKLSSARVGHDAEGWDVQHVTC